MTVWLHDWLTTISTKVPFLKTYSWLWAWCAIFPQLGHFGTLSPPPKHTNMTERAAYQSYPGAPGQARHLNTQRTGVRERNAQLQLPDIYLWLGKHSCSSLETSEHRSEAISCWFFFPHREVALQWHKKTGGNGKLTWNCIISRWTSAEGNIFLSTGKIFWCFYVC